MSNPERGAPQQVQIETAKRILIDRRTISQKHDSAGRETTAATILSVKDKIKAVRKAIAGRETELRQKEHRTTELDSKKAEKFLALNTRLETIAARLKRALRIKDRETSSLQEEISAIENELEEVTAQAKHAREELEKLAQEKAKLPDLKNLLEAYYEKMETVPLSNEEKRELLKPEVLASLSMEEYIALWRRLNPHFLSHVTRQGFRDHNAMVYHSGGLGEFHDGLVNVLQDEKLLRPPMAVRDGLLTRDEPSIKKFLGKWVLQAENESEALDRLNSTLNFSLATAPNYPDKTAVHFATQIVADGYYGGEKSNEVFFLYPADVLASQYHFAFNGLEKDFTQPQSETKWNDVFIWPSTPDNPGIPVDAGVVFLPENTPVDPQTGSKYASEVKTIDGEDKRVMVEDKKLIDAFVKWATSLTEESPSIKAYKGYSDERDWSKQRNMFRDFVSVMRAEMIELGFDEETAEDIVDKTLTNNKVGMFLYYGKWGYGEQTEAEVTQQILRSASANWKRAENTIPAKAYWETYFEQHPEQKPKHVIYYDGSPTTAIHEWQQRNNIGPADTSTKEGRLLGFDDHHIANMKNDPRAYNGYDELLETGKRIITEHYEKVE